MWTINSTQQKIRKNVDLHSKLEFQLLFFIPVYSCQPQKQSKSLEYSVLLNQSVRARLTVNCSFEQKKIWRSFLIDFRYLWWWVFLCAVLQLSPHPMTGVLTNKSAKVFQKSFLCLEIRLDVMAWINFGRNWRVYQGEV